MHRNLKYEDGKIVIDIHSLTDFMSLEEKAVFFQDILFEEQVIQMFTDFVTSDLAFEQGLYKSTFSTGAPIKRIADNVRKALLGSHDEMFKTQITQMQSDLDYEAERSHRFYEEKSKALVDLNYAKDHIESLKKQVEELKSQIPVFNILPEKVEVCGP